MPSLDGLDVTTFTIVKIYRLTVAAKSGIKLKLELEVRQFSNLQFQLHWWSRIFSAVHFVGLQHKKSKVKYVCSNALMCTWTFHCLRHRLIHPWTIKRCGWLSLMSCQQVIITLPFLGWCTARMSAIAWSWFWLPARNNAVISKAAHPLRLQECREFVRRNRAGMPAQQNHSYTASGSGITNPEMASIFLAC